MDFWKCASDAVTKTVDRLMDMNRRTAIMNRLKIVIRNERDNEDSAYIQLGKYYYSRLRDPQNGDTETYCAAVDKAVSRRQRACDKLDELAAPAPVCAPGPEDDACGEEPEENGVPFPEDSPAEQTEEAAAEGEIPVEDGASAEDEAAAPDGPVPGEGAPASEEAADDSEDFLKPSADE